MGWSGMWRLSSLACGDPEASLCCRRWRRAQVGDKTVLEFLHFPLFWEQVGPGAILQTFSLKVLGYLNDLRANGHNKNISERGSSC